MEFDDLPRRVIGCAIEVHRNLGAGLLESIYRRCLEHELRAAGLTFESEKFVDVCYKGIKLDGPGLRADLIVEEALLVEIKVVDRLLPVHEGQLLTYMKLTGCKVGLLMNFDCRSMKEGLKRFVL